jgi:integrase
MSEYSIGKLNGECCLVYYDPGGKRRRYRLGTDDARQAAILAPAVYHELTKPKGKTVAALWAAYEREHEGRAILETMKHTQKALSRFWDMDGEQITVEDCKAHIAERRAAGRSEWTVYTELSHLRTVLLWSAKFSLIAKPSYILRPPMPKPKEDKHLTRDQVRKLFDGTTFPHIRLAMILLYTTAARSSALRGLTWDRCHFDDDRIDLRDPTLVRPHKGRAIVPMLRTAKAALREAERGALSAYVIEWAGERVGSLKKGIKSAARTAGIKKTVSPHVLRHSAAVHMAEDDVSMEKIQQFLGHSNIETTRKIYARFSPNYLREAAAALEFDDLGSTNQRAIPKSAKMS